MGACGKETVAKMDKAAFGNHIHEHAVKLRDKVAEKGAETVHNDAKFIQNAAQNLANQEEYENAKKENRESKYPAPLGADNGYHLFTGEGHSKEMIDNYKAQYHIDLLTFSSSDKGDAEEKLKTHLNYIVEKFDTAKDLPDPKDSKAVVDKLMDLAGNDSLADIDFTPDSSDAVTVNHTAKSGQGKFGDPSFCYIGGMMDATEDSFDSATGQSFSKQFLPRVPPAANSQKGAVRTIRNLVATNQGVVEWARSDLDHLVHDGFDAVEHFDDCKGGGDSVGTTLGLLAGAATIIAGIATIPVSGGLSAAAVAGGATIVAGSLSSAQTLNGASAKEYPLGGDTLDDTVKKIMDKVDESLGKLDEVNTALADKGFSRVANLISGNKAEFAAPVPNSGFMNATQDNVKKTVDDEG